MEPEIVQANYEELVQIAEQFIQQYDQILALRQQVSDCVNRLQNGGWKGKGAALFYAEVEYLVLPALWRLTNALQTSHLQTVQIVEIFQAAEQEAGRLFQGEDGELGGMPAPDNALSGGMNMSGMISTMFGVALSNAVGSGLLGLRGALPAPEAGRIGALSPLRRSKNYVSADPNWYKRKNFSRYYLKHTSKSGKRSVDRSAGGRVVLVGNKLWRQREVSSRQVHVLRSSNSIELSNYDMSGKWEASVGRGSVKIGASGQAVVYLARVSASAETGGLEAAWQALIGAQVQGSAGAVLRPGQKYLSAGGEIFAGSKSEVSISYGRNVLGRFNTKLTAGGYVSYGVGAQASINFGYDRGQIRINSAFGTTLGIGGGGNFSVTIDIKASQSARTVQEAVRNVADFSKGATDIIRVFLP
jgi:WXG100 family type VII secretion target